MSTDLAHLRALEQRWREQADAAMTLALRFEAEHDTAGNSFAFRKEWRVRLEQADELSALLAALEREAPEDSCFVCGQSEVLHRNGHCPVSAREAPASDRLRELARELQEYADAHGAGAKAGFNNWAWRTSGDYWSCSECGAHEAEGHSPTCFRRVLWEVAGVLVRAAPSPNECLDAWQRNLQKAEGVRAAPPQEKS